MNKVHKAQIVAEHYHRGQMYDGLLPYMYHLEMVLEEAQRLSGREDVHVAAILHDILEDTHLSYNDIVRMFGRDVADIVYNVSDNMGKGRNERHEGVGEKIKSMHQSVIVKLADRIANVKHSKAHSGKMFRMYKIENEQFINEIIPVNDWMSHSEINDIQIGIRTLEFLFT